ncbi:MAG: hypothetical protein KF746_03140 [Chitinophagaceae bacterium]|nr:hypothetical protein [Chitinophagaceae bacterium]
MPYPLSLFYNNQKWVVEGSAWEIKQNNGRGIYLSSNNDQIYGHITNLAAKHASDIATGLYQPALFLITTYDVPWSLKVSKFAKDKNVQYYHRRSKYKMDKNGSYKFKFVGFGTSSL